MTTTETTPDAVPPAETEQQGIQPSPSAPIDPPPQAVINASTLQQEPTESAPPHDGDEVRAEQIKKPSEVTQDDPNINVVGPPPQPESPTFKEQVYGYAKLIRGTVLGRSDVKEHGAQVLRGEQGIPLRRNSQSSK
ncbi:hypothetical protein V8E55_006131 [Tylopilus felleus]